MIPKLDTIGRMRIKLGITQKKLASMAGVSTSMINQIESNSCKPSYETARRIFDSLVTLEGSASIKKGRSWLYDARYNCIFYICTIAVKMSHDSILCY